MAPPSRDPPARVRARRANARRSTGPRSAAGRSRAALNALRHGLAVSITALPEHDPAIARLTAMIAGTGVDRERIVAARRIAEAEIDLLRIRRAKLMLLGRPTNRPHGRSPALRRAVDEAGPVATAIGETAREMMRLDRYERRALSRRNSAVRALDALGRA